MPVKGLTGFSSKVADCAARDFDEFPSRGWRLSMTGQRVSSTDIFALKG